MTAKITDQQKLDPWEIKQEITDIKISILCGRYSMLSDWACENLASPFWRIYHSRLGGGFIKFNNKKFEITPHSIVIIPPHTAFSSYMRFAHHSRNERIKSIRIKDESDIIQYSKEGMIDQMFIHFKLGFPYDRIKPNVYQFEINKNWESLLRNIEQKMIEEPNQINFNNNIRVNYFVLFALQLLPSFLWDISRIDNRILNTIQYIESNISESLSNNELSKIANLAKNSFARLFKENIKCSVQDFILQRRIDLAITLFHHSNFQIEEVANKCGFYDRHHFSRVFKSVTGFSPANYRKNLI
jgi:AraC-like DNA-binding protein